MDASLPVALPPPYKSQRGWLIAFGVMEILIGCFFLLMIAFSAIAFFGPMAARMPPDTAGPISRSSLMAIVSFQYGVMAAVFFTGGIGSIRCKDWARIFMLVVSGFWLVLGTLGTVAMGLMVPVTMRQQPTEVPAGIQSAVLAVMLVMTAFFGILLPGIILFFYSRKSVKATCLAQSGVRIATAADLDAAGFPVLLAVLGAWEMLSALAMLPVLFARVVVTFGVIVHGPAALLIILAHSALSGYAAWLIFRRDLLGWKLALATNGFWLASTLVTLVRRPDITALFQQMGYNQASLRIYEQFPQFMPLVWSGSLVILAVLLAVMVYARKFFRTEAALKA